MVNIHKIRVNIKVSNPFLAKARVFFLNLWFHVKLIKIKSYMNPFILTNLKLFTEDILFKKSFLNEGKVFDFLLSGDVIDYSA